MFDNYLQNLTPQVASYKYQFQVLGYLHENEITPNNNKICTKNIHATSQVLVAYCQVVNIKC
jgi:hypothetical protein